MLISRSIQVQSISLISISNHSQTGKIKRKSDIIYIIHYIHTNINNNNNKNNNNNNNNNNIYNNNNNIINNNNNNIINNNNNNNNINNNNNNNNNINNNNNKINPSYSVFESLLLYFAYNVQTHDYSQINKTHDYY